jgi:hypothetical protein
MSLLMYLNLVCTRAQANMALYTEFSVEFERVFPSGLVLTSLFV